MIAEIHSYASVYELLYAINVDSGDGVTLTLVNVHNFQMPSNFVGSG